MSQHRDTSGPSRPLIVARLSEEVYRDLERKCLPLMVGDKTTELQTAFVLGQQSVLKLMRETLVVPTS